MPDDAGRRWRGFPVLLVVLLGLPVPAYGQWGRLSGRVSDGRDDRPLAGVHVFVEDAAGARNGTTTDAGGFFRLAGLRPGRYVFTASFIGYDSYTDTLTFTFGQERHLAVRLMPATTELEEIVVETEQRPDRRQAGLTTIPPSALARVPLPDVTYDLAGYLLTLPGFVAPGDRGGQLFVRGGTPTQNLVLLDGMTIYQPFHIVGFYSAFPADIVAYADVYAGGFGARYGNRISSVIDVGTRNGNKQRITGAVSLAPFLSTLRLELPLVRNRVSVLASVRESVIERISPELLGRELPFRFGDRFLKFHAFLNQTSSFSATLLQTFDEGNIAGAADTGQRFSVWRNRAYGARYLYLPAESAVMTQVAVYGSRLQSRYRLTSDDERHADVEHFNAEILFAYLLGSTQLHFGLFGGSTRFDFDLGGGVPARRENVTSGGAFLEARLEPSRRLRLEPGLRLEAFSSGTDPTLGPRLRLRWLPRGSASRQQFNLAWGLYHQQTVGFTNEQDVTDVFTAWTATPARNGIPRAMHVIAGWQRRLAPWLELSLEAYVKDLKNLSFPRFSTTLNELEGFTRVDGLARGLDVRLELARPALYAMLAYGLAAVTYEGPLRDPATERFAPPHDRRHQIHALVEVTRGAYRLTLLWQFGSGLPFTQIDGYYERLPITDPDDRTALTRRGTTFVARGEPYRARLPAYHRLDVALRRTFTFARAAATLQLGLVNAYDRANIFQYNTFSGERVDQLPLIPSLGLKVELP
ncbi:MAG: TonB-dependent receptor [Rhodothermaceae bacterium]|nr:MAG: TonB-dependent receptor [Rhodothermaceae bacterium]